MDRGGWMTVRGTRPNELSTSLRSHMSAEGENRFPPAVLWPPQTCVCKPGCSATTEPLHGRKKYLLWNQTAKAIAPPGPERTKWCKSKWILYDIQQGGVFQVTQAAWIDPKLDAFM